MSQNLHFWCWIYIFFLPWAYPVNSVFSVIVGIYNIHVLINIFSSLQLLLRWVRKSLFPISMARLLLRRNFLQYNYTAYQFKLSPKKWSQTDKDYSKVQRCIFDPTAKDLKPSNEVDMQQKLSFWIFTTLYHIPGWIWFVWHALIFRILLER